MSRERGERRKAGPPLTLRYITRVSARPQISELDNPPPLYSLYSIAPLYTLPPSELLYRLYNEKPGKMPKGSGLTKPLSLSDELTDLLAVKKGDKLSRPEVVKKLWAYIKEKKLQDPENKQFFKPDKKMEPIFGKEKIRAFGMAKYLKGHLS